VATHGEKRWPPAGRFNGRLRGAFHGHRQALSKLAEQGPLIRHDDEWLIVDPPVARVSTEPTAPQLLLTTPGGSAWRVRDPVEQRPEQLPAIIQHLAQACDEAARNRLHARELAEQARTLCEPDAS